MRIRAVEVRLRTMVAAVSVLTLAATLLFGAVPAAFAKQNISLSAASFDFTANPGQGGQGEVFLSNRGDEPVTVLIYAADQKVDNKGVATFVTPTPQTNTLDSPASWVQMKLPGTAKTVGNTPYVELKPNDRITVSFLVEIPADAVPGDKQIMIFFEMADLSGKGSGVVSKVSGRLAARIKARVAGTLSEELDIRPFVVPQLVTGDVVPFTATFTNGGNVDKRVTALASILDRNETSRLETKTVEEAVFAGNNLEKSGQLSLAGLAPGQYTVRFVATYPREAANQPPAQIVKTRSFWFVPMWLIIVAAALLALLLLVIVWRVASGSARRRAAAAAAPAAPAPAAPAAAAPAASDAPDAPSETAVGE